MAEVSKYKENTFWTPKRIARIAVMSAVSAVSAFVKIPTPTGDVGLDSVPQYFAGMVKSWDWKESLFIGYLAKIVGSAYVGFPRGVPITLVSSLGSAGLGSVVLRIPRVLFGLIPGAIIAFIVNAFIVILGFVPGLVYLMTGSLQTGWTNALASVPGSAVASALSIGIALAAYKILDKALKLD